MIRISPPIDWLPSSQPYSSPEAAEIPSPDTGARKSGNLIDLFSKALIVLLGGFSAGLWLS